MSTNTTTATIPFSTTDYERTHRRAPRGFGSWAFEFASPAWGAPVFFPASTYAVARREALRHAQTIGATAVRVST